MTINMDKIIKQSLTNIQKENGKEKKEKKKKKNQNPKIEHQKLG